jgi:hypothetical protein
VDEPGKMYLNRRIAVNLFENLENCPPFSFSKLDKEVAAQENGGYLPIFGPFSARLDIPAYRVLSSIATRGGNIDI